MPVCSNNNVQINNETAGSSADKAIQPEQATQITPEQLELRREFKKLKTRKFFLLIRNFILLIMSALLVVLVFMPVVKVNIADSGEEPIYAKISHIDNLRFFYDVLQDDTNEDIVESPLYKDAIKLSESIDKKLHLFT